MNIARGHTAPHRLVGLDPPKLIVAGLLLLEIAVGFLVSERFGTVRNFMNVLEQSAALGFVSLGLTLVVLVGAIDLSIGAMVTAAAVLIAGSVAANEALMIPMLFGVLVAGALFGALNGLISIRTGVDSLVVTIGSAAFLTGIVLLYTLRPTGSVPVWFEEFAYGRLFGIPISGLTMLLSFLAVGLFLRYAPLGRAFYAVGGNAEAARLTGIRVDRVIIAAFAASGFFAALAGLYFASRTGIGDPRVGDPMTLAAITPVVVGGTVLGGGRGGVVGTLLGVLLISFLNNILNYMNVSTFLQWVIQGVIIILAVSLYVKRGNRQ